MEHHCFSRLSSPCSSNQLLDRALRTKQQDRRLGGLLDRSDSEMPRRGEGAGGAPESILAHPPMAFSGTTCLVNLGPSDP